MVSIAVIFVAVVFLRKPVSCLCGHWCFSDGCCSYYGRKCELTQVPVDITGNVSRVYLWENQISRLNSSAFSRLTRCVELDLENNIISEIEPGSFNGLTRLRLLDLGHNRIGDVRPDMWVGLDSLVTLALRSNGIGTLSAGVFSSLGTLKILILDSNDLQTVDVDWFHGLDYLERLFLNGNEITSIAPGTFANLRHLFLLELHDNRLMTMSEDVLYTGRTFGILLTLNGNPLRCDTRLCWVKQDQIHGRLQIVSTFKPQCANYPRVDWDKVKLPCWTFDLSYLGDVSRFIFLLGRYPRLKILTFSVIFSYILEIKKLKNSLQCLDLSPRNLL